MVAYGKPFLDIPGQIELLGRRGLAIPDSGRASRWLSRIGYFRLSGYWHPFRTDSRDVETGGAHGKTEDAFHPHSSLETVVDLYVFDKRLRMLFLDAIERIEVSLRTDVTMVLGRKNIAAYRDPEHLHGNFSKKINVKIGITQHQRWLYDLDQAYLRSRDEFVKHFRQKYEDSPLPIWIAMEICDFGLLSRLISGLKADNQDEIAHRFRLDSREILCSWVRSLNLVRNICAHHGRLWNRNLADQPKPPGVGCDSRLGHLRDRPAALSRIYALAAITRYLLLSVSPTSSWAERFKTHMRTFPRHDRLRLASGGFPEGWEEMELWRT